MLIATIIGIITGILLALAPGPLGMTAIKMGLEPKRSQAIKFSIGGGLMDMLLCLIAVFTASAVGSLMSEVHLTHPVYYLIFQILVVVAFAFFGWLLIRRTLRKKETPETIKQASTSKIVNNFMQKGVFFLGLGIAFTNIANPTFMPTLMLIALHIQKLGLFPENTLTNLMFGIGFGFGNFFWLNFIAGITRKYKHKFSTVAISRINQFAGFTFISFAGIIGFRMLFMTKWTEILRFMF